MLALVIDKKVSDYDHEINQPHTSHIPWHHEEEHRVSSLKALNEVNMIRKCHNYTLQSNLREKQQCTTNYQTYDINRHVSTLSGTVNKTDVSGSEPLGLLLYLFFP